MDNDNLYNLFQNVAVSTIAMQSFIHGYHEIAKNKPELANFPDLGQLFYVLPIVYNKNAMMVFGTSIDIYTAIIKDTSITLGLQERANKMAAQTFEALNLGFSKNVLKWNSSGTVSLGHGFMAKRMTILLDMNTSTNSIKRIQDCAHRLGSIFAKKNAKNIQMELNIRF